jgi:hypothetical protein
MLTFSGTVAKAILVWSGTSTSIDRDKVTLTTPAATISVVAGHLEVHEGQFKGDTYVAYADVTPMVSTAGAFTVAAVQTTAATFSGWSLVVITHDDAMPMRSLMIATPLAFVTKVAPFQSTVPNAASVDSADVHVVAPIFEGDLGIAGDTVVLNGTDFGGPDPFQGAFGTGVDLLDRSRPDVGSGDLVVAFATTDDRFMVAAIGIALDLA